MLLRIWIADEGGSEAAITLMDPTHKHSTICPDNVDFVVLIPHGETIQTATTMSTTEDANKDRTMA